MTYWGFDVINVTGQGGTPPAAAITSPANGSTVSGTARVTARASSEIGITWIEISVDGALAASASLPSLSYAWDTSTLAPGSHDLVATAYDADGNVRSSSTVTVSVAPPDRAKVRTIRRHVSRSKSG